MSELEGRENPGRSRRRRNRRRGRRNKNTTQHQTESANGTPDGEDARPPQHKPTGPAVAAGTAGASAPLGDQAARRARPNRKPKMQLWQRPAQQSGTGHDGHVDAPPTPPEQAPAANGRPAARIRRGREVYAAIDLGTNNCRLLVARRTRDGFRVVDAFSRVVRLGEGVRSSGALSEEAMDRAVDALENCVEKMSRRGVTRSWSIATEACRIAENGDVFRDRVRARTGLELDIISTEREASLALQGCKPLIEPWADYALVFDIGGGSTELIWVDCRGETPELADWVSLPSGVVTLTEALEGHDPGAVDYHHMLDVVRGQLADFAKRHGLKENHAEAKIQLLGTSGTVTTLAGIHLKLPRYDRRAVDGSWIPSPALLEISHRLAALDYDGRVAEPCIGEERADLVVAGCAIMEAIMIEWPTLRVRVADRGLREGMLLQLMAEAQRERRKKRRRRGGGGRGRRGGNNKQSQNINAEAAEGTS